MTLDMSIQAHSGMSVTEHLLEQQEDKNGLGRNWGAEAALTHLPNSVSSLWA